MPGREGHVMGVPRGVSGWASAGGRRAPRPEVVNWIATLL